MPFSYPSLALPCLGILQKDPKLALVRATDAVRLCRGGGYQAVPSHQTGACLDRLRPQDLAQVRRFILDTRLFSVPLSAMADGVVLTMLRRMLGDRTLVVVRASDHAGSEGGEATANLRRLIGEIAAKTRRRLTHAGRSYRLAADVDVARLPDRDSYEVVPHDDAIAVLAALAKRPDTPADLSPLLEKASALLSRDWRPPLLPDGLVMLRRIETRASAPPTSEAPITPSQMKAMIEKPSTTWFEVRVVDEVGQPVNGVELIFKLDDGEHRATTAGGKARLDGVDDDVGSVEFADVAKVQAKLHPLWSDEFGTREGEQPQGGDTVRMVLTDTLPPVPVNAERPVTIVLVPYVVRLRLIGMHFDTSKCFLLPSAMRGVGKLRGIWKDHPKSTLYVIGHTDPHGSDDYNQPLSEERAASVHAFLTDDVEAWMRWYGDKVSWEKKWGSPEDRSMLSAVRDTAGQPYYVSGGGSLTAATKRFQADHGCSRQDGTMTAETRRKLIGEYMRSDRVDFGTDTDIRPETIVAKGFGEQYPLPDTEAGSEEDDARNRRVEIYLFRGFAPSIDAYPEWRDVFEESYDFEGGESTGGTSQLSLILVSNSTWVPIAKAPYKIHVEGEVLEGTTDDEGFLEHKDLPSGDYLLEIMGTSTLVPTLPPDEDRRLHMIQGLDLFSS